LGRKGDVTRRGGERIHNLGGLNKFEDQIGALRGKLVSKLIVMGRAKVSKYTGFWVEPWVARLRVPVFVA
jgi:hypothetical protein